VQPASPLVSVIMAAHDAERHLRLAVDSILRQTFDDLELVVIDDGSSDSTPELFAGLSDPRLVVLTNKEQQGLAASLNRGIDHSRGRYVARMDADDIAMPRRLERQLARIRSTPVAAILGSFVCALEDGGRLGAVQTMPQTPTAVRWHLLFSSPFFHPTVLLDRETLERDGARYNPRFLESEDYDLWARLLTGTDGANLAEPLVLYRVHAGQASQRRRDLQRAFQLEVALREIERVAPALSPEEAELAWRIGTGEELPADRVEDAAAAYVELVHAFEAAYRDPLRTARRAAARALARAAIRAPGAAGARVLRRALQLDPAYAARGALARSGRFRATQAARAQAQAWLAELARPEASETPLRVAAVFPEPTPYRAPLLDRVAARSEIDLTVIYAAETVARRTWRVEPRHRAVFLRGARLPGARKVLHHDYPVTPGVAGALAQLQPEVVVVSGWSTFAAQAAIAWCRLKRVPYLLVVESHDEGPRAGWRRMVKGAVVPRIVRGASGALVTGTLAHRSMVSRGAPQERVRVFANTIDVEGFGERADRLSESRAALREDLGAGPDDVVVLSVARLVPEKGLDVLVNAVAEAGDPRLLLVLAGDGPELDRLQDLAQVRDVRVVFAGDQEWERIVDVYVAADIFALLSEREPWAVVVNEAAACGLPLVLSDPVGAAHDLLRDGENGVLVAAGDVEAAADALRRLAGDPDLRREYGARSREVAQDWGYGPSVDGFLAAVREAVADRRRRSCE